MIEQSRTMEFFLPSVLILLLAAAVVFFVFPRFGPLTLAVVSLVLLVLGVYNHVSQFGTEYRLSTWQLSLTAYAPYILIGGLLLAIIGYLVYLIPGGLGKAANAVGAAAPVTVPTIANMPPPETATNAVTATINRGLNAAANMLGANKKNNAAAAPNNNQRAGNANRGGTPFSQI